MCLIIGVAILATVAVVILAFLLYSTRDMVDALKKDINLLETQNARIKETDYSNLKFSENKNLGD